jgi:DNA-directed RNA polymerase II subunit RPB11
LRDRRVLFAGYKCPHPLQAKFELKVRTNGTVDPIAVTRDTVADLKVELQSLEAQFTMQLEHRSSSQHGHTDLWGQSSGY